MNYYNEWDKDAAAWTRELIKAGLIPPGDVDERSITEVKAHELTSYTQCHFFAGVGGWPLAFQFAGISPDENADTGSCPCQPFSGTGKQMGFADSRHLWPAFRRIETRRQPAKIYGEQVASALGRQWLSRVFSDLEVMGYAGSGADLCSAGVGSPNIRQRLYWVGDAVCQRRNEGTGQHGEIKGEGSGQLKPAEPSGNLRVEYPKGDGREQRWAEPDGRGVAGGCSIGGLAQPSEARYTGTGKGPTADRNGEDSVPQRTEPRGGFAGNCQTRRLGYADHARREGRLIRWDGGYERAIGETSVAGPATLGGFWGVADLVYCRDEKWRRIEPGSFPLADGIPSRVGPLLTELRKLGRSSIALARANRNIRLKGYGNAINPWVAAEFVAASRGGPDLSGRVSAATQPLILD